MLISSRIFGISIKGVKTDALVPLADMLNHKQPRQTEWEFRDTVDAFIIESKEHITRGEQVFDSYGRKCNSRFLLNYGFIVENNDANEVPLTVALDQADPLYAVKLKVLGGVESKTVRVSEDLGDKNVHNIFSYLRFASYAGDPMTLFQFQFEQSSSKRSEDDDESYKCTNVPPISIANERQVLFLLQSLALRQLLKYPTRYQDDITALADPHLTFNQRNAILMRSGEKKVLSFLLYDRCCFS